MELSFLLFQKILSMMFMTLMGFAVTKAGIVKSEQSSVLSSLCLYVITPCMILSAFQLEYNEERLAGLLLAFGAAAVLQAIFIIITRPIGNALHLDGVERASLIYSNGGNLIVPLVGSLLGEEYVFYCSAFIALQTFLMWVHLPRLLGNGKDGGAKGSIKKLLLNPNILSIAVGLICFFARITFPPLIDDTITSVSNSVGPVSMIFIGMLMAQVDLKKTFCRVKCYLICFGRLIVYPLLFMAVIRASQITFWMDGAREVLLVTMLATCAPVAVTVAQMANVFGGDDVKASAINVMSVFFCIVTMPLIIAVYQLWC